LICRYSGLKVGAESLISPFQAQKLGCVLMTFHILYQLAIN